MSIKNGEPLFQCSYHDPPYNMEDQDNKISSGSEFASNESDNDDNILYGDNDDDILYDTN